ncbi:aspartate/glutamate racemase family protein [Nocardioides houyundeii]|uniref:aspartate/glutamate racemase family protein n=1 Tax=Nocardioides houyundeii TaxID=2045452 RepID=UPI000DF267D5|nr:aspartate/glutamate racemase family protein [Nocardioides houyundeii]
MTTLGILGGMSWHSTVDYYTHINEAVARERGGHHSAELLLASMDFGTVRALQVAGDWDGAGRLLGDAARRLQGAGAEAVLIATNLMHKVAPAVEAAVDVPLLHIGDAVGHAATAAGYGTLGVVGTRWVMEEPFYADRLGAHGLACVVPGAEDRQVLDEVIFSELTLGVVREESRATFARVLQDLASRGAEAVVLACTEIQLLVRPEDSPVPLIDSMAVHAAYAAQVALGEPARPAG